MSVVPRFPQPFLELLGLLLPWRDVLSLTSVDWREAPMRHLWISEHSVLVVDAVEHAPEAVSFVARFPRCIAKQTIRGGRDRVLSSFTRLVVNDDSFALGRVCLLSLTHLTLGHSFNRSLSGVALPPSLRYLAFGDSFDQPLARVALPASIAVMTFGYCFNQSLDGVVLPASLTRLTFGVWFDQPLDRVALPPSLTHLTLGYGFNQALDNVALPPGLTHLALGGCFNRPLGGVALPASLVRLTIGDDSDMSLDRVVLPPSLTVLGGFGDCFSRSLSDSATLTCLRAGVDSSRPLIVTLSVARRHSRLFGPFA